MVTEESGEDDSVSVHFYEEEEIEIVAHSNSKQVNLKQNLSAVTYRSSFLRHRLLFALTR